MKKPNTFWIVLVLTCTSFFFVNGQDGEAIFKQNCAACHKLGKRFIGPDLIGVNQKRSEDWLLSFIKSSQTMIKSGDADAVAIYEEFNQVMMTDLAHLSDDDIKTILSYIEQQSSSMNSTEEPVEIVEVVPTIYSAEDIQKGQNLFSGKTRFSNGGASCISCHNVTNDELISGGLMAKDLTNAYARMGEAGVGSIISSPPFPVMATAYEKTPLDSIETSQLTAFLKHADEVSDEQEIRSGASLFILGGGGGIIILFLLIELIWKKRLRKSVKENIYNR